MASIKLFYGNSTETCWSSTSKITTPSLILNDNGTIRYTPLFSGNVGGYGYSGYTRFALGHLVVSGKRAAISAQTYKFDNSVRTRVHDNVGFNCTYSYQQSSYPYTKYYHHYYYRYYYICYDSSTVNRGSLNYVRCNLSDTNANYNSWTHVYTDTATYANRGNDTTNHGWYPGIRSGDYTYANWTSSGCVTNSFTPNSGGFTWPSTGSEAAYWLSCQFQLS